jgi:hypothetical protein
VHSYCLPFLEDGFDQFDDNMTNQGEGITQPGGKGDGIFLYLPYCILHH